MCAHLPPPPPQALQPCRPHFPTANQPWAQTLPNPLYLVRDVSVENSSPYMLHLHALFALFRRNQAIILKKLPGLHSTERLVQSTQQSIVHMSPTLGNIFTPQMAPPLGTTRTLQKALRVGMRTLGQRALHQDMPTLGQRALQPTRGALSIITLQRVPRLGIILTLHRALPLGMPIKWRALSILTLERVLPFQGMCFAASCLLDWSVWGLFPAKVDGDREDKKQQPGCKI